MKAAYHIVDVRVYIPNPLRCFSCQKFGRSKKKFCARCAEEGHTHTPCNNDPKCVNCGKKHQSNSKECESWQKEKEILKIKYSENVSFPDARTIFDQRNKTIQQNQSENSYANVAKPKTTECTTCKLLLDKICSLFPDKAEELRKLVETTKTPADRPIVQTSKTPADPPKLPATVECPPKPQKLEPKEGNTKSSTESKPLKTSNATKKSSQTPKHVTEQSVKDKARPKLSRLRVENDSPDVAVGKIPVNDNKCAALEDMDAQDNPEAVPPSSWKVPADSWDDDSDHD